VVVAETKQQKQASLRERLKYEKYKKTQVNLGRRHPLFGVGGMVGGAGAGSFH
jgi:hypothetical protein